MGGGIVVSTPKQEFHPSGFYFLKNLSFLHFKKGQEHTHEFKGGGGCLLALFLQPFAL